MKASIELVHAAIEKEDGFAIKWGVYTDRADHIFFNRMVKGIAFIGREVLVCGDEYFFAYEMEEDGDSLIITDCVGFKTREDALRFLDKQMLSWYIELDDRGELR